MSTMDYNGYREALEAEWIAKEMTKDGSSSNVQMKTKFSAKTDVGLQGTGSPEGAVTANPGQYYTDTAGTSGAWLWLKKAGTGATGWAVVNGDTGLREVVAAGSIADMPNLRLYLRRINRIVNVLLIETGAGTAASGNKTIYTLPVGFRVSGLGNPAAISMEAVFDEGLALITTSSLGSTSAGTGALILKVTNAKRHYSNLTFITSEAWPTELPGTVV